MSTPGEGYGQQNQPGQGQQYGEPAYGGSGPNPPGWGDPATPTAKPRNGAGIASLILGILSIILCWFGFLGFIFGVGAVIGLGLVPTVLGLLAVILGFVGVRRVGKRVATNRGVSIVGIVLGILGLLASVAVTLSVALGTAYFAPTIEQAQQCVQQAQGDPIALQRCQQEFSGQISNLPGVGPQQPDGG